MLIYAELNENEFRNFSIPKAFIQSPTFRKYILNTMYGCNKEAYTAIYLYYFWDLSVEEIVKICNYSEEGIHSLVFLFKEEVYRRVETLKKSLKFDMNDCMGINEVFDMEIDELITKLELEENFSKGEKNYFLYEEELFQKIMNLIELY